MIAGMTVPACTLSTTSATTLPLRSTIPRSGFLLVSRVLGPPFEFPSEVSLVDLDRTAERPVFLEQDTNLFEHAPRGFVGDASLALDLLSGDPATSRSHQVDGMEPRLERRAGDLWKIVSRRRVNVMAAMVAGVRRTRSQRDGAWSPSGTSCRTCRPGRGNAGAIPGRTRHPGNICSKSLKVNRCILGFCPFIPST